MSKQKNDIEATRSKRIKKLSKIVEDDTRGKKERKAAAAELDKLQGERGRFIPIEAPLVDTVPEETEGSNDSRSRQDAEVAAQWAHQRKLDAEPSLFEVTVTETDHGTEFRVPAVTAGELGIEAAVDPVLVNGNGQAVIHYVDPVTGKEKTKGYTRVTTYIDGLDDKTVLTKWKMRTLLEGAAADMVGDRDDWSIATVGRAMIRLDAALADIDSREKIDGELLGLRRAELLKEHRTLLEGIAEDLMERGGAHEKANKGTDLHRYTELVDHGRPLPDDITESDRRDVEAYKAKMAELGIDVLWTERRVVLDDIQVSGTMDRAYHVKLPGAQRRIRVVGDLKTGSVSWGAGKISMQLALYARGLGYDHAKPLERERLSLSKVYGLLVHLPQGEGVCEVYLVDLELAAKGLALAAQVREWRNTSKRAYDLKSPLSA